MLIGLVLKTAYLNSHFNSLVPTTLTFSLLVFFAYDWLSRTWGISKMPKTMLEKAAYLHFLKIFLDLAVVYFLLVFSLKFVEAYTPVSRDGISCLFSIKDDYFYYSIAMFAFFSGAWNALLIFIFKGLNRPHIITLFKGHLDQDLIEMFPQLIKKWRAEIQLIVVQKHAEMRKLKDNHDFNSPESIDECRKKWRKLDRELGLKLFLNCLSWKPYRLLLPYFFVFHIIALNFFLGIFIGFSTYFGGMSLSSQLLSALGLSLPVLILVLGVVLGALLSLILLIGHFMSSTHEEATLKERFGCWILFITTICGYFLCSSAVLVILVIVQQVIANIIMTLYFEPPSSVPMNVI